MSEERLEVTPPVEKKIIFTMQGFANMIKNQVSPSPSQEKLKKSSERIATERSLKDAIGKNLTDLLK